MIFNFERKHGKEIYPFEKPESELVPEQLTGKMEKLKIDATLKVGDEVDASGGLLDLEPTRGVIVEIGNDPTNRFPKVQLTEGPHVGKIVGPLYFYEFKKPGTSNGIVIKNEKTPDELRGKDSR